MATMSALGHRPVTVPETEQNPTCSCGQPLDTCHAAHCPRCGIALRPLLRAA